MIKLSLPQTSVVAILSLAAVAFQPYAEAQSTVAPASTPKQVRKAQRKAARADRTAEVKQLENNGYKPGKDQANYPQDIQNAERKAGKGGVPSPASAP